MVGACEDPEEDLLDSLVEPDVIEVADELLVALGELGAPDLPPLPPL